MISSIPKIKYCEKERFFLIAGPCVIEEENLTFQIAEHIAEICDRFEIPFIFKASFKKANRTRISSFSGIDSIEALDIIRTVGEKYDIPTLTDIHLPDEAAFVANYADVLQIPAFLCRQTDLLVEAAKTGNFINIKKGQFVSPESMAFAVEKVVSTGNKNVMLTERGTSFGYQDLIVDFRNIAVMQKNNVPVVLDVTHSLQQPNQSSGVTGGQPQLIEMMARAGIAAGADGIFIETHPDPSKALSDGANMLPLSELEKLLSRLVKIQHALKY